MKLAILIGNNSYLHLEKLPEVINDLKVMEIICKTEYEKIKVIESIQDKDSLIFELSNLSQNNQYDIEDLLFYYSGHGAIKDNNFLFLLEKVKNLDDDSNFITDQLLDKILSEFKPKRIIKIIDACRTISDEKIRESFNVSAQESKKIFKEFVALYASSQGQKSLTTKKISIFTLEIVKAVLDSELNVNLNISKVIDITREKFDSGIYKGIQTPFYDNNGTDFKNCNLVYSSESMINDLKGFLWRNGIMEEKKSFNILMLSDLNYYEREGNTLNEFDFTLNMFQEFLNQTEIDLIISLGNSIKKTAGNHSNELLKNIFKNEREKRNIPIIFGCGPNELDERNENEMTKHYFENRIRNNEFLDGFVKNRDSGDYKTSIKNIESFNKAIKNLYGQEKQSKVDDFYLAQKYTLANNITIGIVSINSAWKVSFQNENYSSVIPMKVLEDSYSYIQDSDLKIFVTYFSNETLKQYNKKEVETFIFSKYDIFLSNSNRLDICNILNGIFLNFSSKKFFSFSNDTNLGFNLLEYSFSNQEVKNKVYEIRNKKISQIEEICQIIPKGKKKTELLSIRLKLLNFFEEELEDANQLLVSFTDQNSLKFLDIFTEPVLKTKSRSEIMMDKHESTFNFHDLLSNENYFIHGNDKSGKTSALKKIQLEYLANFPKYKTLPLYIDLEIYFIKNQNIDIKLIKKFEEKFGQSILKTLNDFHEIKIKLLFDNFNGNVIYKNFLLSLMKIINDFINKYPNTSFILMLEEDNYNSQLNRFTQFDRIKFQNLYIHDIGRKHINELTNKWPDFDETEKAVAIEKIISIFSQFNLPFNYWTVSLFLWVYNQSQDKNIINTFNLLDLHIDKILEKDNSIFEAKGSLSFNMYKDLLSKLAYVMYSEHQQTTYSMDDSELRIFLESYKTKRINFNINELIAFITKNGVLKCIHGRYSFRLSGVFEYFLALYMGKNQDFKKSLLGKPEIYLSFANEFELYAGSPHTQDHEFVNTLFIEIKKVYTNLSNLYNLDSIPEINLNKINDKLSDFYQLTYNDGNHNLTEEFSENEKQDIYEDETIVYDINTDVKIKRSFNIEKPSPTVTIGMFHLFGRVYKSAIYFSDDKNTMLKFLIENFCNLIFYSLEEEKITNTNQKLFQLLGTLSPLLTQILVFDSIANGSMIDPIKELLEEYATDMDNNYFKIFVLYFLFIDITSPEELFDNNIISIKKLYKKSKFNVKESIILKLIHYLKFKKLDPQTRLLIQELVEEFLEIKNPKTDKSSIHRMLSEIYKASLSIAPPRSKDN